MLKFDVFLCIQQAVQNSAASVILKRRKCDIINILSLLHWLPIQPERIDGTAIPGLDLQYTTVLVSLSEQSPTCLPAQPTLPTHLLTHLPIHFIIPHWNSRKWPWKSLVWVTSTSTEKGHTGTIMFWPVILILLGVAGDEMAMENEPSRVLLHSRE